MTRPLRMPIEVRVRERKGPSRVRRTLSIILLALFTLLLTYFSLSELEELPLKGVHMDKLYHALSYAVLAILLALARRWKRQSIFTIFLISTAFGLLMEFCQFLVPYRNASITDALANGLGAIAGAYGGVWLMLRFGRW